MNVAETLSIDDIRSLLRTDPKGAHEHAKRMASDDSLDTSRRVEALLLASRAAIHMGEYATGQPLAQQALSLAREHGLRRLEGLANNELGVYCFIDFKYDEALNYYSRAESLLELYGVPLDVGKVYVNVGNVLHRRKQYIDAVDAYERVLGILETNEDKLLEAKVLTNLSSLYQYVLYDFESAIEYTIRGESLFRELNDFVGLGKALHNHAQHLRHHGKREESVALYREALDLRMEFAEPMDVALNFGSLIACLVELGRLDEAEEYLHQAYREFAGRGEGSEMFNFIHMAEATLLAARGRSNEALELFARIREWTITEDLPEYTISLLRTESNHLLLNGNYKEAAELMAELVNRMDAAEQHKAETRLLNVKQRIERAKAQSEAAVERLRNVELANAVAKLEQMGKQNEEYVAFLAHELKNPLNTIRTVSAMLAANDQLSIEERIEFDREIHAVATRMFDLVTKTLQSSQTRLVDASHPTNATVPFIHVMNNMEPVAAEKGVALEWHVTASELYVRSDDQTLVSIYENLTSNAVKFSSSGSCVVARLNAQDVQNGERVLLFSVSDAGPGLSAEDQLQLFQPFSRLSAKPTGNEVSTGLGLHLVKRAVDQLQGRIWCDSEVGLGATFVVEIPLLLVGSEA